ncbi:ubiquitin-like modifier-activating enzyme 6 isoform X2 [Hydra vulgaris]|uniref:ubiquitin-like modifier-activating enzyme 6 isoform X2 n=1 Tax=Hydra vulgaris TaxID=6087 RepID=UPI001F5E3741|nr:ubiquitin-like modifier-activating enzyme 6 isoform X2 [Hydra vulgaris]
METVVVKDEIDDSLYSRQRYVLGDNAMQKLAKSNVLIIGLGGLGVEVAKNVILAGVNSLTLLDEKICQEIDLGTQFFLTQQDVNNKLSRASACRSRLAELNPHVSVQIIKDDILSNLPSLKSYHCVVITEMPFSDQVVLNNFCREQTPPIYFISGDVRGLFSYAFCDFGNKFEVTDIDGEEYREVFIGSITKSNPAVVGTLESRLHGLQTGDKVLLKGINGMLQLNFKTFIVQYLTPYTFSIDCDTSTDDYQIYEHGGVFCKIKTPTIMNFQSLEMQLTNPSILLCDLSKLEYPLQTLLAFQSLYKYISQKQTLNNLHTAFNELYDISISINSKVTNSEILTILSRTGSGVFAPLCAVIGGIISQEVLKCLTSKFTPLYQFYILDAMELSSSNNRSEVANNRYFSLNVCLSPDLVKKMSELSLFMVGCGAIGCELLKNFALVGLATKGDSILTITDNDLIEKSNLNRQFLFRPWHIQQSKSLVASKEVCVINPDIKIEAHQNKISVDTENIYNDHFFQKMGIIINALDNIETRRYIDGRCVSNTRPLIETGTMGTKGHVQVIVPHLTETYSSQRDPVDEDIPYCTLKSFPQQIEHTIQWARDKFDSLFTYEPEVYNKFWDKNEDMNEIIKNFEENHQIPDGFVVSASLLKKKPANFECCVKEAYLKFYSYFHNKALQLLNSFPLDTKMADGTWFWQSPKKPPSPIHFDPQNPLHIQFVTSYAMLLAKTYGIWSEDCKSVKIPDVIKLFQLPEFNPSQKKVIIEENQDKENKNVNLDKVGGLIQYLSSLKELDAISLSVEHFEKDNDSNGHLDFIYATANLRAIMYGIENVDRYKIKRIAGRIIPAIATTTSVVAGLATLELLKVVAGCSRESLKNCFLNLAIPLMVLSEPAPAPKIKIINDVQFTCWDRWDIHGHKDYRLKDFVDYLKKKCGLTVNMVCQGLKMIYIPFMPGHPKRLNNLMTDLLKPSKDTAYIDLIVAFQDPELNSESDLPSPPVRYYFL